MCVPAAGCALGRAFLDLQQPPFDPTARRADALLAGFPCGESYINQLLYTLRTGAVLDPRLRLRLCDFGNAAHVLPQLLTLALAIAAPSLYVRCRHFFFIAISAASLLGAYGAIAFAPDSLLLYGAAGGFSREKRRVSAAYFSWKITGVLQLPSSLQLYVGPVLWLLFLAAMVAVDRRMVLTAPTTPPGAVPPSPPPQHLWVGHAAVLLSALAVLPYLVALAWERVWLMPQYRAYLRSCSSRGAAAAGGGGGTGASSGDGGSSADDCSGRGRLYLETTSPSSSSSGSPAGPMAAAEATAAAQQHHQHQQHQQHQQQEPASCRKGTAPPAPAAPAATNLPRPCDLMLYRSARGGCRTVVFSIKAPLPPGCSFDIAAARLSAAAAAKLRAACWSTDDVGHHQDQLRLGRAREEGGGGGIGWPQAAASGSAATKDNGPAGGGRAPPPPSSPRRKPQLLSMACIEGCVHLLVVLRAAVGEVPAAANEGRGVVADVDVDAHSDRIRTRHVRLLVGGSAADGAAAPGGRGAVVDDIAAAFEAALAGLLYELEYDSHDDSDDRQQRSEVAQGAGGAAALPPPPPLLWPPVLRRLQPAAGAAATPPLLLQPSAGDGDGAAGGTVLVLLPAQSLPQRGPTASAAVRCVVVGPVGRWQQQQQQQQVYLDEEMQAEELFPAVVVENGQQQQQEQEGGGGSATEYRAPTTDNSSALPPPLLSEHSEPAAATAGAATAVAAAAVASTAAAANTDAAAAASSSSSCRPLATLPLLVLPDAAAEEVRQLYGSSVFAPGGGAGIIDALDGLLLLSPSDTSPAAAAAAGPSSHALSSGSSSSVASSAERAVVAAIAPLQLAAAAAAAQHHSGLLSLAYDIGSVLGMKYGSEDTEPRRLEAPSSSSGGGEPPAAAAVVAADPLLLGGGGGGTDPRVISSVLSFLEEHGMTACLAECRSAVGHVADDVSVACSSSGADASRCDGGSGGGGSSLASALADPPPLAARVVAPAAGAAEPQLAATGAAAADARSGGSSSGVKEVAPTKVGSSRAAPAAAAAAAAAAGGGDGEGDPAGRSLPAAGSSWRQSWPSVLLLGFWSPALEAAYQDFKAAQCEQLDRAALALAVALRAGALWRTYTALRRPSSGGYGGGGGGGGGGDSDGQQQQQNLQLLSLWLYFVASLLPLLLTFLTAVHVRHRNRLLLLRAFLDSCILLLTLIPLPAVGPRRAADSLLPVPELWLTACRRHGIWLYRGVLEPCMLQLSPHLAMWPALVSVLHLTLLFGRCYGGGGRGRGWPTTAAPLLLAVGNAAAQLAIAAAVDLHSRRRFLQMRSTAAAAAVLGGNTDNRSSVRLAAAAAAPAAAAAAGASRCCGGQDE
ncbi:hypothetical protein PLESTM_001348400 [Pleodorina starrii]|nr:hypothetical protein PLESTM_001348400 [Pleodorina starrii]